MIDSIRPDLSILIVNWNTRDLLKDCLDSVRRALRCSNISVEVIVVDNGSKDGSAHLVRNDFPGVTLLSYRSNLGFALANNKAMSAAKGRHILLLNSDTVVHGDVLDASVAYLDCTPDVGAMGCTVLNPDGSRQRSTSTFPGFRALGLMTLGVDRSRPEEEDETQREGRDVEVLSGCYLMARREAIDQVGVLDDSFFFFGEETDWCLRLRKAGWRLVHAPVGQITHLGGGSAKKLQGHRDLLLTGAFVRLQRKHHGQLAGLAMWCLLLVFNGSRGLYWSLGSLLVGSKHRQQRRDHFRDVLKGYHRVWAISTDARAGAAELRAFSEEAA